MSRAIVELVQIDVRMELQRANYDEATCFCRQRPPANLSARNAKHAGSSG